VSLAESTLRSMYPGPSVSPKSSPQAGGDALVSKPAYTFTRFGLWEAANAGPAPLVQQGPQDTPSNTPAEQSASGTPSPQSDVDQKAAGEEESLAAQDGGSVKSVQEDPKRIINRREGHRGKMRPKGHNGRSSEGSGFANIKSRLLALWHHIVARSRVTTKPVEEAGRTGR
jgi:hypothetical protein